MSLKGAGKRSEHMSSGKAVHTVCTNRCKATAEKYRANEPTTGNARDIPWVRNMELAAYTVETIETIKEMTGS